MMVCVTGMHRSGTSMVTRLLNICGLYLGPKDRLLPAMADNPAGFWEDRAAVVINDAILSMLGAGWDYPPTDLKPGWELDPALDQLREKARDLVATFAGKELWGWKDPRFCLTLPLWKPLLPDHRVVICLRHPLAVADSLMKRNGHSAALGLHLWLEHYRLLLKQTDPDRRVVTHYDSYFPAPQEEISRLLTGLGWSIPQETIDRAGKTVSDALRHSRQYSEQVAHVELPAAVAALYQELLAEAGTDAQLPPVEQESEAGLQPTATLVLATSSEKPLVSIIMLSFNALEYTKKCIDSVRSNTSYPHELIIVDNGSKEETKDYLRQLVAAASNYRLLDNASNLGFAAGNNQGVKAARGEYILLLNNDVLVGQGWLDDLVAALERDERIGMVGPITNYSSGLQMVAEVPYLGDEGFPEYAAEVRRVGRGRLTPRRRIAGFALLMRKALFDELQGFEESFGSGNYEDDDLCLRVRERGYAIMVDEGTFVHHYGSATFKANRIDYAASLKRNEKLFRKRWPEVDHKWLLEQDEPLTALHKARLDEAANLIEDSKPEAAAEICLDVLKENPISEQAHYGLGLVANMQGDHVGARNSFRSALKQAPASASTIKRLTELDILDGDMAAAQAGILGLLERDSADIEGRHLLAQVLLKQGDFNEAIALIVGILKDDPQYWEAHLTMASLYDELERANEVLEHVRAVLAIVPDQGDASQLLAKYSKTGTGGRPPD